MKHFLIFFILFSNSSCIEYDEFSFETETENEVKRYNCCITLEYELNNKIVTQKKCVDCYLPLHSSK